MMPGASLHCNRSVHLSVGTVSNVVDLKPIKALVSIYAEYIRSFKHFPKRNFVFNEFKRKL
jgi:hypothetical protein